MPHRALWPAVCRACRVQRRRYVGRREGWGGAAPRDSGRPTRTKNKARFNVQDTSRPWVEGAARAA